MQQELMQRFICPNLGAFVAGCCLYTCLPLRAGTHSTRRSVTASCDGISTAAAAAPPLCTVADIFIHWWPLHHTVCHPALAGASTGNTQSPIDARYKFAPSNPDAQVAVADSSPLAHGDQPVIPQVCTELEAQPFEPHGMHALARAPI